MLDTKRYCKCLKIVNNVLLCFLVSVKQLTDQVEHYLEKSYFVKKKYPPWKRQPGKKYWTSHGKKVLRSNIYCHLQQGYTQNTRM